MIETDSAVTAVVTRNPDDLGSTDLDRLAASLDHLGLHWSVPDRIGDSHGR